MNEIRKLNWSFKSRKIREPRSKVKKKQKRRKCSSWKFTLLGLLPQQNVYLTLIMQQNLKTRSCLKIYFLTNDDKIWLYFASKPEILIFYFLKRYFDTLSYHDNILRSKFFCFQKVHKFSHAFSLKIG